MTRIDLSHRGRMTIYPLTHAYLTEGHVEELSEATRSVFNGMEVDDLTVRVGPVTVARDLLTSASKRCVIVQPFIDDNAIVSHTTAAWIHWGIGTPFPLTVCSSRRRGNDGLIRHVDKRAFRHLDLSLPIRITTPALTIVQLFDIGVLADTRDGLDVSGQALYAYAVLPSHYVTDGARRESHVASFAPQSSENNVYAAHTAVGFVQCRTS